MTVLAQPKPESTTKRHPLRSVAIAAGSVPVLIAGEFAMLAIVPVAVVVWTTWRNGQLRPLRPWAAGLAALYAVPLVLWAIGPDRAPSLSKDMAPSIAVLIILGAVAFVARTLSLRGTRTQD
jgi:hypothetical protein